MKTILGALRRLGEYASSKDYSVPFLDRWQHRTVNISQCQYRAAGQILRLLPIYILHIFLNFTRKNTFLCFKLNVLSATVNIVCVTPISRNKKTRRPYVRMKTDSHIACRAAKGLECVFSI